MAGLLLEDAGSAQVVDEDDDEALETAAPGEATVGAAPEEALAGGEAGLARDAPVAPGVALAAEVASGRPAVLAAARASS